MNRGKAFLIRTARTSSLPVLQTWQRWRTQRHPPTVRLDSVRRRLELLLAAMYDRTIRIEDAESPTESGLIRKLLSGASRRHVPVGDAIAASDGECIRLPRELADAGESVSATAQYRLLAMEHAERIVRGTAALLPAGDVGDSGLERDLYLICEAVVVDNALARSAGGTIPALVSARANALARRPPIESLTSTERAVELVARRVLSTDPAQLGPEFADIITPTDSLAWARSSAARIRGSGSRPRDNYRGIAPVALWGTVLSSTTTSEISAAADSAVPVTEMVPETDHWTGPRSAMPSQMSESLVAKVVDRNGPPSGESAAGVDANATKGIEADSATESGSLSDNLSDELGGPAGSSSANASADVQSLRDVSAQDQTPQNAGVEYPEWDCNAGRYRPRCTTVRAFAPEESDPLWATDTLSENAVLVRRVRQQFERLRSQRIRIPRQRDGDELDIAACVRALVDRRMGQVPDDRLYVTVQPARRSLAIALLVDVSGSTNTQVSHTHQVIDVEKMALLFASEALDALGDRYAMLTFSSLGAGDVRVAPIKKFGERNGETVRRRISAIAPGGNTRLGAAIRHATALLANEPAGHRLLLVLSDGKPSDTDRYFEQYAVEDSRQAVFEARAQDIYPFCLTVDAENSEEYLSHMFGPAGHTILRQPEQLPLALLKFVRQLLGAGGR